jgi:hypothetical protein
MQNQKSKINEKVIEVKETTEAELFKEKAQRLIP